MSETDAPAPNGAPALSSYGVSDTDHVVVFDPKTQGLKLASGAQAKALAAQGYKIGAEAEAEQVKNDPLSKAGTFLTHAGNMGSFGLLNLGLAAGGRRGDLINQQQATEANPLSAIAGDVTGVGAQIYGSIAGAAGKAAGTALAKVGEAAAPAAKEAVLPWLAKAVARNSIQGAPGAALYGISSQATEDAILKHPMTAEKFAHSAFTDILWNALFSNVLHGAVAAPKALRSGMGNFIDKLDELKFLPREKIKVPVDPEAGPTMTGFTQTLKEESSDILNTRTASHDLEHELRDTRSKSVGTSKSVDETASYTDGEEFGKNTTSSRTTTSKPILNEAEQAAATSNATAEPIDTQLAHDAPQYFEWDGHTKDEKNGILRAAIKQLMKDKPEHLALWDENAKLEELIKAAEKQIEAKQQVELNQALKNKLIGDKEAAKELLSEQYPTVLEGDKPMPGFRHLNDEMARVNGKIPYSDRKLPGFGVKVPDVKGAKPKAVGRVSETESGTNMSGSKTKTGDSNYELRETGTRTEENAHSRSEFRDESRINTNSTVGGKTVKQVSVRWKMPKAPVEYEDGKYLPVFGHGIPAAIAVAGHYAPPFVKEALYATAAGMEGANGFAKLANHRLAIGPRFEKFGKMLTTTIGFGVATGGRVAIERSHGVNIDPKHYDDAQRAISHAASNPEIINHYMQKRYPQLTAEHPELMGQVQATMHRAVQTLDQASPKKPFAPTLQQQKFKPPRAQQVKFLNAWRLISNPEEALSSGDPATLQMLKTIFPAWHDAASNELMQKVSDSKKPIRGHMARQVSSFTGAKVRPQDDAAALKRLQETAGPDPKPQQQPGGGKSTGGAKSAKITQAAVSADATSIQTREMGL